MLKGKLTHHQTNMSHHRWEATAFVFVTGEWRRLADCTTGSTPQEAWDRLSDKIKFALDPMDAETAQHLTREDASFCVQGIHDIAAYAHGVYRTVGLNEKENKVDPTRFASLESGTQKSWKVSVEWVLALARHQTQLTVVSSDHRCPACSDARSVVCEALDSSGKIRIYLRFCLMCLHRTAQLKTLPFTVGRLIYPEGAPLSIEEPPHLSVNPPDVAWYEGPAVPNLAPPDKTPAKTELPPLVPVSLHLVLGLMDAWFLLYQLGALSSYSEALLSDHIDELGKRLSPDGYAAFERRSQLYGEWLKARESGTEKVAQTLAREVYQAYGDCLNWRTMQAYRMPSFEELPPDYLRAWNAVIEKMKERFRSIGDL